MSEQLFKKLKLEKFQEISMLKPAKEASPFDLFTNQLFPADLVLAYVYSLEEMKEIILDVYKNKKIRMDGQLFILYPKNKNKLGHEPIGRDSIFPFLKVDKATGYVEDMTIKFNRMNALDSNYTLLGLKYTSQIEERSKTAASQKSADYQDKISLVVDFLSRYPSEKDFFIGLTLGYQRGWARYIYSAKSVITQEKRQKEMVHILKLGFKSRELYRSSLK